MKDYDFYSTLCPLRLEELIAHKFILRPSGIGDDLVKNATTGGTNPIIKAEKAAFGLPHQSPSIDYPVQ